MNNTCTKADLFVDLYINICFTWLCSSKTKADWGCWTKIWWNTRTGWYCFNPIYIHVEM